MFLFKLYYWVSSFFFFLMIRRPPRSTLDRSSAASDVYKRQVRTWLAAGLPEPEHLVHRLTTEGVCLESEGVAGVRSVVLQREIQLLVLEFEIVEGVLCLLYTSDA